MTRFRFAARPARPATPRLRRFAVLAAAVIVTPAAAEVFPGTARPAREVTLTSPVDARLEHRPAEGATVAADQPVARFDDTAARLTVAAARVRAEAGGDVDRLTLELARLTRQRDRTAAAAADGAAPAWELDEAEAQRGVAAAQLRSAREARALAEAELALEEERLRRFVVEAPFAGRVTDAPAEPGARLSPGDDVLRLVQLDPLEVVMHLPDRLYGRLAVDTELPLGVTVPEARTVTGTLVSVNPEIDPGSRTFRCVFVVPNPERTLPAGIAVTLDEAALGK